MKYELPPIIQKLINVRISIPNDISCTSHNSEDVFDFLDKNMGLTEEFIYNNTNAISDQIPENQE